MNTSPIGLSVIVPARNAAHFLSETLPAIRACAPPGVAWELIVADDASDDGEATSRTAQDFADVVLHLPSPRGGPARARNLAAARARGAWLFFVDADVKLRADALQALWAIIQRRPELCAVFGIYDDDVSAQRLASRYRNLLHRWTHLQGAGEAETFWTGIGAVRRDWFTKLGGFDEARFRRPQIEDIELGYRLRDAGGTILLDSALTGTHLKNWTVREILRSDFCDRGLPWMKLLLERGRAARPTLNVGRGERIRVAGAGALLGCLALAFVVDPAAPLAASSLIFTALLASHLRLYMWFARQGGPGLTLTAIGLHMLQYCSSACAAATALVAHKIETIRRAFGPDEAASRTLLAKRENITYDAGCANLIKSGE